MEVIKHVPEVPLNETWEWRSDILQSYDGTEQRIALRGAPRFLASLNFLATNKSDLNTLWASLVVSRSEVWMPEFQYAVRCTQPGVGNRLYFDANLTDVRVGENVYVEGEIGVQQVQAVYPDGCDVQNPFLNAADRSLVVPAERMIFSGNPTRSRYTVDNVAEFDVEGVFQRARDTLIRPGTPDPLTYWNSVAVLDARPLANSNPQDAILEDNIIIDNDISLQTLVNRWDEAKVQLTRQYMVHRVPTGCSPDTVKNLDWWRHFLQFCRGSAKKFWLPLYRYDYEVVVNPPAAVGSIILKDFDYVPLFQQKKITHIWLQITSDSWVHRTEVSNIGSVGSDTEVFLADDLPSLAPITSVELILPCRLQGDSVELEHYQQFTIMNLIFRSAENV